MIIEIYSDGACSAKNGHGVGGAAAMVQTKQDQKILEEPRILTCSCEDTTNQQMELSAALLGLNNINKFFHLLTFWNQKVEKVVIYSDSAYLVNCFNEKWYEKWIDNNWVNSKKQPVANKELWALLINVYNNLSKKVDNIEFIKVKGHSNNINNNIVDQVAVKTRQNTVLDFKNYEELVNHLTFITSLN